MMQRLAAEASLTGQRRIGCDRLHSKVMSAESAAVLVTSGITISFDKPVGFLGSRASVFGDEWRRGLIQRRLHDTPLGVDDVLPPDKIPDAMDRALNHGCWRARNTVAAR
jgi:hypothetical protein